MKSKFISVWLHASTSKLEKQRPMRYQKSLYVEYNEYRDVATTKPSRLLETVRDNCYYLLRVRRKFVKGLLSDYVEFGDSHLFLNATQSGD